MTTRRAFLGLLAGSPAALAATTLKAEPAPQPEPECVYEARAMDGSLPTSATEYGRSWCRTHGFNCPNTGGR